MTIVYLIFRPYNIQIIFRIIITKCNINILKNRLKKRKYNEKKIKDNLEAEIFNVCFEEAKEKGHKILIVDTSKGITKDVLSLIA